ncbi:hypothetical protein N4R57_08990 [Rhodobacteraceae bacterium D3-12]|nr:hypothetical protein N4R57_08990 [Rhodobacteraceae bacterium D3-12]
MRKTPGKPPADKGLQDLIYRVGRLNYAWTNTESLLIHLIAGLSRVDKETAVVIFLTLNTTRARVDLVERLAKLPRAPKEQRTEILKLTTTLSKLGALRNKYNHCIYSFDPESGDVETILMRIQDRKEEIRMGKKEQVTQQESSKIDRCIAQLEGPQFCHVEDRV